MTLASVHPDRQMVRGRMAYHGEMEGKPCYFANDHSRDVLNLEHHEMDIANARRCAAPPTLTREGFCLVQHPSAIADFLDKDAVKAVHIGEVHDLLLRLTGADHVEVGENAILRFAESSNEAEGRDNSRPARFIHVDISEDAAQIFAAKRQNNSDVDYAQFRRYAHYNIWRTFSPPPQDVPLALCDSTSVLPGDLIRADALFDPVDKPGAPPIFGFEGFLLRHNPDHRWYYYPDMTRDEALVFKTYDSDRTHPCLVPHTGFDDPTCPDGVPARASIEIRAVAFFKN
ncbi:MAG: hypothetical protein E2598_11105 [Sphingobium sp.]|nr:hypothetical protein [Sphingobium sp.]